MKKKTEPRVPVSDPPPREFDIEDHYAAIKRQQEEFKEWSNSADGIRHSLMVVGEHYVDDDQDVSLVVRVLQKIPEETRAEVLEEVVFVVLRAVGTTSIVRLPTSGGKDGFVDVNLLVLNFVVMEQDDYDESKKMNAIAHEIAHWVLGHHKREVLQSLEGVNPEREADALAVKWGFRPSYSDYSESDRMFGIED